MKKIYWIILIMILCYWGSSYSYTVTKQEKAKIETMETLKQTYDVINDSIDYILTMKGATKTIVVLAPFCMLYCRYFDADPIQNLVNYIIRSVGRAEELYVIQKEMGKSEAFWEILRKQPLSTLSVVVKNVLNRTVYVGLPFMAGVLFKLGLGVR